MQNIYCVIYYVYYFFQWLINDIKLDFQDKCAQLNIIFSWVLLKSQSIFLPFLENILVLHRCLKNSLSLTANLVI